MQYWQVLKHTKGSPKLVVQYDMQDNQHASQVCGWLNSQFSRIKARKNIEDRATKRIQKQTQNAVAKMSELTAEARTGRSQKLRGRLKAELARIKEWEHARKSFLDDRVSGNDGKHAGVFQLKSAARQELKQIEKDSKKYQQFVTDYLSTGADADIKILGCLVVE
jgi:hypothetical protein